MSFWLIASSPALVVGLGPTARSEYGHTEANTYGPRVWMNGFHLAFAEGSRSLSLHSIDLDGNISQLMRVLSSGQRVARVLLSAAWGFRTAVDDLLRRVLSLPGLNAICTKYLACTLCWEKALTQTLSVSKRKAFHHQHPRRRVPVMTAVTCIFMLDAAAHAVIHHGTTHMHEWILTRQLRKQGRSNDEHRNRNWGLDVCPFAVTAVRSSTALVVRKVPAGEQTRMKTMNEVSSEASRSL